MGTTSMTAHAFHPWSLDPPRCHGLVVGWLGPRGLGIGACVRLVAGPAPIARLLLGTIGCLSLASIATVGAWGFSLGLWP